ncbi:MAG: asparaginase [Candidatus Heteroscillospira sp.]|jgi:L-asparaginase
MKSILLIATGGTIASKPTDAGLTPRITSEEILSYVPEVKKICRVTAIQLYNLDSTNMDYHHWTGIARCIKENYDDYDGFVVTHGTDTMAYTAAALSYMVQNSRKPIVLTGSQKSIYFRDTDARGNLKNAFLYAASEGACGVHLVFDNKVILGTRARKTCTKSYNAFSSIDHPNVAEIRDGRLISFVEEHITAPRPDFYLNLNPSIFVYRLIPGADTQIFSFLKEHYDALVIASFGVGGVPCYENERFIDAIQGWLASGKTLVMSTQVPHEGSDMAVYEVGYAIKKRFELIEAYNMTQEAIVTKLMWVLGQTRDKDEIRRLFYKPVARDIL